MCIRDRLSAKDTQGRECTASKNFLLFSLNDKRPPFVITDGFYQDGLEFDAASPATIYIGSSEKNVYLLYDCLLYTSECEVVITVPADEEADVLDYVKECEELWNEE